MLILNTIVSVHSNSWEGSYSIFRTLFRLCSYFIQGMGMHMRMRGQRNLSPCNVIGTDIAIFCDARLLKIAHGIVAGDFKS